MATLYDYCKQNNKEYLLQEWDYELNKDYDIKTILTGSNKKVSWVCSHCGNKWKTSIYHRTMRASGCPKCRFSKRLNYGSKDSLSYSHPEIAKDWHLTKNGKLKPEMFSKNSRYKIWWKCHICGKEIETEIKNYSGCTTCKKQIVLNERNLSITHYQLLSEWDYTKNTINPSDILASNPKKVWWKCKKCGYEWQAKISNRAVLNRGCPCCANKIIVTGINDLATTHPNIAKEWHPTKNGNLSVTKITYGSNKKVWWLCPQGHEYQATIGHRTSENGTGCPICNSGRQTSFAEQAVYYYVKKLYPDAINRYTADFLGRMELDIFIPSINYAIEYDGEAWHKGDTKLKREEKKYKICRKRNIKLIRLREEEAPMTAFIADYQWCRKDLYKPENLEFIITELLRHINFSNTWLMVCPVDVNIERDKQEILKYKNKLNQDSLQDKFPKIAKEWHPTKNGNLEPSMFKAGTDHKVWWLCPTCGNEYEAAINKRATKNKPTGCPKCGLRKAALSKSRKVNMIDISTNEIIRTFDSILEASKELNINGSNISMVCRGQRNFAGGYKWSYA